MKLCLLYLKSTNHIRNNNVFSSFFIIKKLWNNKVLYYILLNIYFTNNYKGALCVTKRTVSEIVNCQFKCKYIGTSTFLILLKSDCSCNLQVCIKKISWELSIDLILCKNVYIFVFF